MGACGCRERDGKTQDGEESRGEKSPIQSQAAPSSLPDPFNPSPLPLSSTVISSSFKARQLDVPFNSLYQRHSPGLSTSLKSELYPASFLPTGKIYLINKLTKNKIKKKDIHKEVVKTAELWGMVTHPNLIPIIDVVYDLDYYYIVSENTPETAICDLKRKMSEKEAAGVVLQVLSVLKTAQKVHLTINPASVFILNSENSTFLLQNPVTVDRKTLEKYSIFTAPEVEKSAKSDVWSCGVLLYYLLSSEYPYDQVSYADLQQSTVRPGICFTSSWNAASAEVKDLLEGMLEVEGERRMTVEECLEHRLLMGGKGRMRTKLMNEAVKRIRIGRKMTPLKAAITHFLITKLLPHSDLSLHIQVFDSLDQDCNGVLSESELLSGLDQIMPHEKAVAETRKIMSAVQLDGDNTVNYNEYLCAAVDVGSLFSMESLSKAFSFIDKDGSGSISTEEMKMCLFGGRKQRERMWEELIGMKELKTGNVTFNEFAEIMKGQDRS